MYEPISGDDGEGNALRFLDVLESVDEDIPERMEKEENVEKLYGYIEKNLTEREKLIIRLRYGVSEGKGTPEIRKLRSVKLPNVLVFRAAM